MERRASSRRSPTQALNIMAKSSTSADHDTDPVTALNNQSAAAAPDEAKLRAEYEARIADLEQKLAASNTGATGNSPDARPDLSRGKPATYFHQQGLSLVARPVIAIGDTLHDPESGDVIVTKAKASVTPVNGCFVRS